MSFSGSGNRIGSFHMGDSVVVQTNEQYGDGTQICAVNVFGDQVQSKKRVKLTGTKKIDIFVNGVLVHTIPESKEVDSATIEIKSDDAHSISTTSVAVHTQEVKGSIDTISGSVYVEGNVEGGAKTTSGNIDIKGDTRTAPTVSGDIRVKTIHGKASTLSGDIRKG